jgi:hypothetical protein
LSNHNKSWTSHQSEKREKMGHDNKTCPCTIKDIKLRTLKLLPQLKKLCRCNNTSRQKELKKCDDCLIQYFSDTAKGVLHTKIKFKKYDRLKKHKNLLRYLDKDGPDLKKKRKKLIEQKGGFLNIVIPAIVSGIAGLIGRAVGGEVF